MITLTTTADIPTDNSPNMEPSLLHQYQNQKNNRIVFTDETTAVCLQPTMKRRATVSV